MPDVLVVKWIVMKMVVNENLINYLDLGNEDKPTIVFLHGWLDNLNSFKTVANYLGKDFRIILVDLPGFGESSLQNSNYNLSNYIDLVKEFVNKLNVVPYAYVGHSFGGRILIKGFGEGILNSNKLILIGSAGIKESQSFKNKFYFVAAKLSKLILEFPVINKFENKVKNYFYNIIGSDYKLSFKLKEIFKNIIDEDLQKYAKEIRTKTLLIYGEKDSVTPVRYGELFNKLISTSNLEIIKDGTHIVHKEQSEKVASLIRAFLV